MFVVRQWLERSTDVPLILRKIVVIFMLSIAVGLICGFGTGMYYNFSLSIFWSVFACVGIIASYPLYKTLWQLSPVQYHRALPVICIWFIASVLTGTLIVRFVNGLVYIGWVIVPLAGLSVGLCLADKAVTASQIKVNLSEKELK